MKPPTRRGLPWPQRLHQQLALVVSACLVLALGLLGGYTASEQTRVALHGFESQASALARNVAVAGANAIVTDSLDQLEALVVHTSDFDEVQSLQVFTPDGRSLSHVTRQGGGPPRLVFDSPTVRQAMPAGAQAQLLSDPDTGIIVAWQPVLANELIAWVCVRYSVAALHDMRLRIWRNTVVVAVLAVSLSAALLALFLKGPMQALNRARQFAHRLPNAGGEQMPFQPGPIEVQELNASLNETSVLLRQQTLMIEDSMRHFQRHEAQLALQNDQLNALFALCPDGLVTFNREGRVQFANQVFFELTGLDAALVLGHTRHDLDARLKAMACVGSVFTGLDGCFEPLGEALPQTLVRTTPSLRVVTLHGQRNAAASVSEVLYVCDVTQQHHLDQMKSEFLSMAAHELRTPMVSIFGFTELMLKREMPAEQRQDLLGRIYRHSQSMVLILNELLDLARIEARRGQDFSLQDQDLAEVARSVVVDFKPPAGREPPTLVLSEGPLRVRVDTHKMQQAILNILSNAYKYSPDGGEVVLRLWRERTDDGGSRVGLAVRDHGMGLTTEHLQRMGERFFRADKSGNIPGTGLGVSIVKELMNLMGGHMQIDSTLGEGTTVTLWLPLRDDEVGLLSDSGQLERSDTGGQGQGLVFE